MTRAPCTAVASTSAASAAGKGSLVAARMPALRRAPRPLRAVLDDNRGGTGVLERPKFDQGYGDGAASTESGFGAGDVDRAKKLGGGNFRVLLLDHEKHTEPLVVRVVTTVVPGTDEDHARNVFRTSRELGMAIVTTCLKEHAEFYATQMFRAGCRASIEPDTTTI